MNKHKFLFICGLHRSGTSVLFRSLRDHPEISGFSGTDSPEDEGMHLQSVYKPSGAYGGAGKFGFHPEAYLNEESDLATEANARKIFSEWLPYWDQQKKILIEKSPPNLIRTRFLQKLFPNSYFVILFRHPIAVSYATRNWYRKFKIYWRSLSSIMEHWLVCHDLFSRDLGALNNVILMNYEHYVADPDLYLKQIYDFVDVDPLPCKQEILTRFSRERIIGKFEERFNQYGYSLKEPTKLHSTALNALMPSGKRDS